METVLSITDHEASLVPYGFPITLPPSQQAPEKNVFKNSFWQGRPSPPKRGIHRLMEAAGFLTEFAVQQVTEGENIQKFIVEVLKGDQNKEKQHKVIEFFNENWDTILKTPTYKRPERISVPSSGQSEDMKSIAESKQIDVFFSAIQLAVIYDSKLILPEIFLKMESDKDFCKQVLLASVETTLKEDDLIYSMIPDEAFSPSTMHLAVKYSEEALKNMIKAATKHELLEEVFKLKDSRQMSLLQFSSLNKTLDCVETLLASCEERRDLHRSQLYTARNIFGESSLHTARTTEMISFLLRPKEVEGKSKDQCLKDMTEMIFSRDKKGTNALGSFISRNFDLAEHFLNLHVSTNGYNSNSEKFVLCLDLSPIIGQQQKGFEEVDEVGLISSLEPLTRNKRNFLLHPLINTYIMMKYNSYAPIFLCFLLLKLVYAISLTGLGITAVNLHNTNNSCDDNTPPQTNIFLEDPGFWIWFIIAGVLTCFHFFLEITEMVLNRCHFTSLSDIISLATVLSIFIFQALLVFGPSIWLCSWMKYLASWTVFAGWLDITMAMRAMMFGKYSSLGLYLLMLKQVTRKVLMFFGIYFTLILGFAFAFHVLLSAIKESPFEFWSISIVKIVAMMIGEVEYGDTFADKNIIINLIFVVFVFFIPIIINNLLIGLTVSNVGELIKNANSKSLESKIRKISAIESSYWLRKIFSTSSKMTKNVLRAGQEVCIQPSARRKSILSEEDLTIVHKVDRDDDDQRKMGETVTFLKLCTYVPISVTEECVRRLGGE